MEKGKRVEIGKTYGSSLIVATHMKQRITGFLVARPKGCTLLISPCHSIHTFGMRTKLDIAFFSKDGVVLRAERDVAPGRLIRCKRAVGVLERRSEINRKWYREGEKVMLYV